MRTIEYLDIPQVAKMLTENEKKVVKAQSGRKLAIADEYEIVEVLDRAAVMTGTAWSKTQDDLRRVVDFIREMYGNLTTEDFVNAFMFLCAGEIDMFLPADRSGQPDRNSYGAFNEAYIGKVLRAYSLYTFQVWRKVNYYLPKAKAVEDLKNEDVIKQSRNNDVMTAFENWRTSGHLGCDSFTITFIWQVLNRLGMVQGREATSEDMTNAFLGSKSEWRKNDIKRAFSEIIRKGINLREKLNEI